MVKIAICGANGKMGRVVAETIDARSDAQVVAGIDVCADETRSFPVVTSPADLPVVPDVIIDFSHPSTLDALIAYAKDKQIGLVLATTGYSDAQIAQIKDASKDIAVFFTFNMSLGINLLVELAKKAASILGEGFDVEIVEKHHNQKIDAPSGTAIMLANAIQETIGERELVYERHSKRQKRDPHEIGMHSIRGGTIVGEHDVIFAGKDEVITLSHAAASKSVFAVGAVNAGVFLCGKPAGLYDMAMLIQA